MAASSLVPVVGYARVSTAEQGDSGLGLAAQEATIRAACRARGLQLLRIHQDVASGGSLGGRPELAEALATVRSGGAAALVVAKLDRLSRSVHDFSGLLEQARREGWGLVVVDLGADTMTPPGELVANVTASTSQYERRMIGLRTREALAVKRAQGVRLGRPPEVAAETAATILRLHRSRWSATAIARQLEDEGVPAPRGGPRWHVATVTRLIARNGGRLTRGRPPRSSRSRTARSEARRGS
ncbi:MAG TPA: recombinase family protein [Verrucomicrobiae bacterium]|nr:recombinase family protein [Verrucomicrobiae bacterium]